MYISCVFWTVIHSLQKNICWEHSYLSKYSFLETISNSLYIPTVEDEQMISTFIALLSFIFALMLWFLKSFSFDFLLWGYWFCSYSGIEDLCLDYCNSRCWYLVLYLLGECIFIWFFFPFWFQAMYCLERYLGVVTGGSW